MTCVTTNYNQLENTTEHKGANFSVALNAFLGIFIVWYYILYTLLYNFFQQSYFLKQDSSESMVYYLLYQTEVSDLSRNSHTDENSAVLHMTHMLKSC